MQSNYRRYLTQFAPMSLSDMVMALGDPIIVFVLASLPNSTSSLAAFALGKGIAVFFESPIISILPVSNVLSISKKSREVLFRFALLLGSALMLGMLLLSLLPDVSKVLPIEPEVWTNASLIVLLLSPWPLIIALRRFWQGQIIHEGFPSDIAKGALLRCIVLTTSAFTLMTITTSGAAIVAGSLLTGVLTELIYVRCRVRRIQLTTIESHASLPTNMISMGRYYWPLAQSMISLWGARLMLPFLVAFTGEAQLAAWAAAWVLVISVSNGVRMLQQLVIRHLQIIPIDQHQNEKKHLRKFSLWIGLAFSGLLVLLAFSPWGHSFILFYAGGNTPLASNMQPVLAALFLMPLVMAMQHYLLGLIMTKAATDAIGRASLWSNIFMVIGVTLIIWLNFPLYAVAFQVILAMLLEIGLLTIPIRYKRFFIFQNKTL